MLVKKALTSKYQVSTISTEASIRVSEKKIQGRNKVGTGGGRFVRLLHVTSCFSIWDLHITLHHELC